MNTVKEFNIGDKVRYVPYEEFESYAKYTVIWKIGEEKYVIIGKDEKPFNVSTEWLFKV